ncbi:carbon starvation CstA family protein [Parapedobacter tibetensis]|uniref:carbon starvation CstA family protein n=1 Tax=Parapedobacter tibetensis TaxID=2972951 RepID=UPI0027E55B1E|nr:carbon starvation CstA family protein [Parapedobacter tibetensis]
MEFLNGINALTLVFSSLLIFAIAYRFYGIFIVHRVLRLNGDNVTPAVSMADGRDYVATNKNVLFGHHFAAIAAARLRQDREGDRNALAGRQRRCGA